MNACLLCSVTVASMGCLLFGFNAAVFAGATKALAGAYRLSPGTLGVTVSSALWGALLGCAWALRRGGRVGRRTPLRVLAVLYGVTTAGCTLAWSWQSLAVFRLIGGAALGGLSVIGALYIAEIAPDSIRKKLVALLQFSVALGIALAYFANYLVGLGGFGAAEWRWKLGVACALAYLFCFALFFIPESPARLLRQARPQAAREVLAEFGAEDVEATLQAVLPAIPDKGILPGRTLFQGEYRLPAHLAISIGLFSQLAGISAILYYMNDVLERAGISPASSNLQAVTIGFTSLVVTLLGQRVMERMGRKELLLAGSCGAAMCLAAVALILHQREGERLLPGMLIMFITFSAVSQGRLIWVYVRELFPSQGVQGQTLTLLVCLFASALVSGLFPALWSASPAVPFAFFALVTVVQFLVVLLVYPETKADSAEELDRNMELRPAAPRA